jgi:hypothetical protein
MIGPMGWLGRLFRQRKASIAGMEYRVNRTVYSADGKRAAEFREFANGETYLLESEWVEGTTFKPRHEGRVVGPFHSPERAERFIVATDWFNGGPS